MKSNILVAYASKHGSTREIAEVIAKNFSAIGMNVELSEASEVTSVERYEAVVLGSAIYMGQWQSAATEFIDRNETALKSRQVWLFSSGPIGEDPYPKEDPPATAELLERTGANEHQSFTGKLDRSELGFGERLLMSAMRAPSGDFRDWDAIRAWATTIAQSLQDSESKTMRTV